MNHILLSPLAFAGLLCTLDVRAEDAFYAGAAVSKSVHLTLYRNGVMEGSDSNNALKLFGGYRVNRHLSIETGYANFGNFEFRSGPRVGIDALYVAAKGSLPIGSTASLYGKLGLSRLSQRVSGTGLADGTHTKTGSLFGLGLEWHLNQQLSLSLELAGYGTIKSPAGRLRGRSLELGIQHRF